MINILNNYIITIFCDVDNYCLELNKYYKKNLLPDNNGIQSLAPRCRLSLSEIMTIAICFHLSGMRNFKTYYKYVILKVYNEYFPKAVSYNRFVEIMQEIEIPLMIYLSMKRGECTGISFVDSTTLDVCDSHRINQHKVFKGIAQRGKSSTGWFYGFKLHLAINDRGEIIGFCLTAGNIDDRNLTMMEHITCNIQGKVYADKGYISQKLFKNLLENNIELITKVKKNMKGKMMKYTDRILLRKRAVIESVNDFLKNICQIEHSRHRCINNFIINVLSGLAAYAFIEKKHSVNFKNKLIECNW